ncbi:hypothetical protein [Deinococcus knuensis]|uniref:Uncharacterized protein n=1 Tax=Deinococcus knuensis TaxID=1837380 RepID=A0ABQ2SDF6_9DEIO|nr:hypothetical protein [Deinococcus knuensis]GGS14846.1 hypothetical protein GCM10008961_02660 [Deinococcus knuensis]
MKTLKLPAAMIGLTALLTACPSTTDKGGVTPPAPSKVSLTLNLTGLSIAPVKVTNTTTNTVLNDGTLNTGKTFGDLAAGTVLKVEPGNVDGFTTPAPQTVTLDASKTITLEYKTVPGNPVQAERVAGTVTGAPAAATRAVLIGRGAYDYDFNNTGTVKGGVLDLPLTEVPDSNSLFNLTSGGGCTFTGSRTSDPSVALFTDVELFSEKIDSLAFATEQIVSGGTVPGSQVARLYSAAAATVKGTVLCTSTDGTKITVSLDVVLNSGWNALEYAATNSTLTLRSLGSGVRSALKATAYTPSVLVSLGSDVTITSDAGASVPARLYQEGGYTGQVSLSTDVPGLTIEPSTVNLTATTLQSVQAQATAAYLKNLGVNPQRLDTNLTFKYSGQENVSGPFTVIVRDTTGKQVGGGYGYLEVRKPGLTLSTCGSSALELYPSSTASLNVCGSSIGNFSGPVTYSATGLPAGVTVTPVTQTLNGYSYVSLDFKSDATLKPGTYPITLTADGGTVKASAATELRVPAPTVNIAVSSSTYYGPQIYQGGTAQLNVDVSTQNGFNGKTTLTVTGLPAGVTATPKTVTVTPGSTTSAAITLTATADAALGSSTIKVTSPDQSASSYGAETQLSVRPARTALGTYVSEAVAASSGLWAVTGGSFDSSISASRYTVTRFTADGKVAASGSVTSQSSLRLIETAGGVVAYKGSGAAPSLIADDGTVTELPAVNFYLSESVTRRTDGQGRVWFVESAYTGTGGSTTSLKTWTPATGVVTTVDSSANYGYGSYGTSLTLSPDGNTLIYLGGYAGDALKVDTATGTVTKLDLLKNGASLVAIAADGTIWFSASGQLARLNADSTVTRFTSVQVGTLVGFDRTAPAVLWGHDTSTVYRIDTAATVSASTVSLGSVSDAFLNAQGGVQVVTNEYGSNATNYYLSQLK